MEAGLRNELVDEVHAFVDEHWNPELGVVAWRRLLLDAGLAVPSWPTQWFGRDLPAWTDEVVWEALREAGAVAVPVGGGMNLAAPTIRTEGPDPVRERFLAPTLTGEELWCQLFSEPGAGSDLAGLSTTAELDGDEWVVSGQKVWNTSAHHADLAMLVARTDWSVPKHRGLTYLVLPMDQPGVEVRPLRQMNRHSSFNEVFLTEARIPRDWVVGEVGRGWGAAMTTLAYERHFGAAMRRPRYAEGAGRTLTEARHEAEEHFATYSWYPQRAGRADLLVEHARQVGRDGDPLARQGVADALARQSMGRWTAERAKAARALGRAPGSEGSIGKLATSELARRAGAVHGSLAGAHAMLRPEEPPAGGEREPAAVVNEILESVPGQSIAGGTDEIQKNILGERVLGLPREPAVDRDVAFRDVRRNA
ncbi:MAG: acyl-CoA dehydrogenase family protein [Acidimicrobiales bacterium]